MNPHVSAVVLGVRDLNRAKQFYSEGLGCPLEQDHPGLPAARLPGQPNARRGDTSATSLI